MSFQDYLRDDARLRVLQQLSRQQDNRLGDGMLQQALQADGHNKSREFIRTQLHFLADQGAITILAETPAVMVVELTRAGEDHVARRGTIEGVKRPEVGEK